MYNYNHSKVALSWEPWQTVFVEATPDDNLADSDIKRQLYADEDYLRKAFKSLSQGKYVRADQVYEAVSNMYYYGGVMASSDRRVLASLRVATTKGPGPLAQAWKKSLTLNPNMFKDPRSISHDVFQKFIDMMTLLKKGPWQAKMGNPDAVYQLLLEAYTHGGIVALLTK